MVDGLPGKTEFCTSEPLAVNARRGRLAIAGR